VFTNTIGDPGRGERIADAVLDDDAARAEVTAPITDAVLAATGLPSDRAPAVDAVVDRILRDPSGARAFTDPFAGSWARLLGEEDPRPAVFDLAPLLDDAATLLAPLGVDADIGQTPASIEVPSVPLPRTRLGWMGGVRRAVAGSILPLAFVAAGLAVASYLVGDRPRVLRRIGIWAIVAGALWVVVPPLVVLAARSWARGADAVIAASLDEATADLRLAAVLLMVTGAGLVVGSTLVPVGPTPARATPAPVRRREPTSATWDPVPPAPAPTRPPSATTRQLPATTPTRTPPVPPAATTPGPPNRRPTRGDPDTAGGTDDDVDSESLWDFYR
jgi:hypothetical protein